jgi:hypothetical protein
MKRINTIWERKKHDGNKITKFYDLDEMGSLISKPSVKN